MSQRRDRVPDILLERLALGELPPDQAASVAAALEAEPGGADRLAALRASNEDILRTFPPRVVAAEVDRRAASLGTRSRPIAAWVGAFAAAAAAALLVWLAWPAAVAPPDAPGLQDGVRLKGDPILFVHRKTQSGSEALESGATVHAGDRIQLSYLAEHATHGVIVSVDGRGAVTLHYPRGEDAPTTLDRRGSQSLPFSYELDDAPRFERFFFVTAHRPIDVAAVLDAVRAVEGDPARPLNLAAGLRHSEVLLNK